MRERDLYRLLLLLLFWLVFVLALWLPSLHYSKNMNAKILEEAERNGIRQLELVHLLMTKSGVSHNPQALQEWAIVIAKQLGLRITYVSEDGKVVADSDVTLSEIPDLENHANRPEIMEARQKPVGMSVRRSSTLHRDLLYLARTVYSHEQTPQGVLRLAIPYSEITSQLHDYNKTLAIVVLAAFAATIFLGFVLNSYLRRSVASMVRVAEGIGKGDFDRRAHVHPTHSLYPLAQSINQMADSIEDQMRTISDREHLLESILNSMQEGIMLLGPDGKIRKVNRACRNMISGTLRIEGRRPLEVVMNTNIQDACDKLLASGEAPAAGSGLEVILDRERTYNVNVVRVQEQQRDYAAIVVFHDITELKRLERIRQDFVANVSHELRTPLTSIKGYVETLLSEPECKKETMHPFLEIILKNANHMAKMANDLLELARLETQVQPIPATADTNAVEVVSAAFKACAPLADARQIKMMSDLSGDELWVRADFDQLLQVFRNLLENAIRYSPVGNTVTVSCKVEERQLTFGVHDEGPGIPRKDQGRIFERFYRVEKHRSERQGSTGLGLAICRHIIRNHGGRIWVESLYGGEDKGTTLLFTLPPASRS